MKRNATAVDDRQMSIPVDLPPGPRQSSDERARNELLGMIDTLEEAKAMPWSARLLGWQAKRFAAMCALLTPLDAAALQGRFDAELERLGPPTD